MVGFFGLSSTAFLLQDLLNAVETTAHDKWLSFIEATDAHSAESASALLAFQFLGRESAKIFICHFEGFVHAGHAHSFLNCSYNLGNV